ncbi:Amiloride-sensitive sodium channel [Ditylenchus destructor]|uniref:Amiloride-sensitive sodium channel n=1 Tax=Ditylenchus destructor TaxID=166010 RepID=A0AAD4MJG3_9BILA|nr:Amiloride-sensitive sodium channel [Ditylenchus destructor]
MFPPLLPEKLPLVKAFSRNRFERRYAHVAVDGLRNLICYGGRLSEGKNVEVKRMSLRITKIRWNKCGHGKYHIHSYESETKFAYDSVRLKSRAKHRRLPSPLLDRSNLGPYAQAVLDDDRRIKLLELDVGIKLLELDVGIKLLELDVGIKLLELDVGIKLLELDGEYFTMSVSHNADTLEGYTDCMTFDVHGRPTQYARHMEGKARGKDGVNEELCLGMRHEVEVEITGRYVQLPSDEPPNACKEYEECDESEFDCKSRCRMEMIKDMCNCTAHTLAYLASDNDILIIS